MQTPFPYSTKILKKHLWCFSLIFLFLYQGVAASSQKQVSLFVEKSTESESEEHSSEKEVAEEGGSELSSFGKPKKTKKSPPKFPTDFTPFDALVHKATPSWVLYIAPKPLCYVRPLALPCPRYIAYHQLIFYEI